MAKMQSLKNFHIVRCKCMYVCIYFPAREHHARRTARPKGAYSEWCIFNSFTGCFTTCSDKITARFLANGQILLIIDVKTFFYVFLFLSRFYVFNVFTARCTLVQSAVLPSHVACLSVRLSVRLSVCL